MKWVVLLGRVLLGGLFVIAAPGHFQAATIAMAAAHGVPLAKFAVPLAGVIAFAGGLSVILGFKARLGGVLLALFLVPVTVMMHDFWAVADAAAAQMQRGFFLGNLSHLGGALLVCYFGAGPLSLDAWLAARNAQGLHAGEASKQSQSMGEAA
jgi:putative oxidoreductase